MSQEVFDWMIAEVRSFANKAKELAAVQTFIVELIPSRLSYYNWTGFYMLDPNDAETLVLGPFQGAPTEHVRIPVGRGICGAAVAQNATVIVDDVHADPRYLACSLETKSEIVVPIHVHGKVVGEIDIDSHMPAAFSKQDEEFLEQCADVVGSFIEGAQGREERK